MLPGVCTICCIIVGCPVCWFSWTLMFAAGRTGVCFVRTLGALESKFAFWFIAVWVDTELAGLIWAPWGRIGAVRCCACGVLGVKLLSVAGRAFCVGVWVMLLTSEISAKEVRVSNLQPATKTQTHDYEVIELSAGCFVSGSVEWTSPAFHLG